MDVLTGPHSLKRWTLASLIANCVIVVTGALVRLTASGLGCSTWPQCTGSSYTPVPASGLHGVIEFGNRLLTFVLVAISIGTFLAARARRPARPRLVWESLAVGLGIIAQAVIGGVSVWMQLNPWVVGLHMIVSAALILICVAMVHEAYELAPVGVTPRVRAVVRTLFGFGLLVVVLGTVVTGAGPNSGDGGAQRNGFGLEEVARLHSLSVWATVALTVLAIALTREATRLNRVLMGLAGVEVLQGIVGYAQYFTHLPIALVMAHMVLTTLFLVAVGHAWLLVEPQPKISGSSAAATKTSVR
ncbi:MAG: COX15/CtaA family protein [Propionibacteriaceae bacterium]|nr:COX15/CtaA family protein [Micropruina sp.]